MDRVRFRLSALLLLLLTAAIALTLPARGTTGLASSDGYSHGTTSCLQGIDGDGTRLRLRQRRSCAGNDAHPYLEIDVRENPISANKNILIGETNHAFRCQNAKKSCEQFFSGEVMFSHFEETTAKGIHTDGWYELRFSTGLPETGRFKVDCMEPC